MSVRLVAAAAAAAAIAGCGGASSGADGTATLWVTRDRGVTALVTTRIASGQTAMQALDRETDLETRYGGRYVQAVNGVEGSLSGGRDWFYFVNGYEGDRSAAEYRVRPGDVVWFDYREWHTEMSRPVVVGAYPEPFLHGFDGERRPAVVVHGPGLRAHAREFAQRLGARVVRCCRAVARNANVLKLMRPTAGGEFFVGRRRSGSRPGDPVAFVLAAEPERLNDVVLASKFRYEWRQTP